MNRRERMQQKKKKARQVRLRNERHATTRSSDKGMEATARPPAREDATPPAATDGKSNEARHSPPGDFFNLAPAKVWLDTLLAASDAEPIVKTLWDAQIPAELMLNARTSCELLVAAELVTAACGRPSPYLPEKAARWLHAQELCFSPGVVSFAADAARRVAEFSELRLIWEEMGLLDKWLACVADLESRLALLR